MWGKILSVKFSYYFLVICLSGFSQFVTQIFFKQGGPISIHLGTVTLRK